MKTIDQIYHCQMPGQVFGFWHLKCRLRIFQPHAEVQTVLITDMGEVEMGRFIPYIVECLVDRIIREFHLDPAKLIWIEHYTPGFKRQTCADFSQVTFEWHDGQATNPQWMPLSRRTVQAFISADLPELAYNNS